MKLLSVLLTTAILFIVEDARGQAIGKEGNVWVFGAQCYADFNSNPPLTARPANLSFETDEGCAIACGPNGQIVMYSDGSSLYNKNHNAVKSQNMGGHTSSTQSGIFVPINRHPGQYFLYAIGAVEDPIIRLMENKIQTYEDNDTIRILQSRKVIAENTSEKISSVLHCNKKDMWIATTTRYCEKLFVYKVTEEGVISPPTITPITVKQIPRDNFTGSGQMKFSADGDFVAIVARGNSDPSHVIVGRFDNFTGKASDWKLLKIHGSLAYGVEWSPNSSYLYISSGRSDKKNGKLERIHTDSIFSSLNPKLELVDQRDGYWNGALQLAPNGKIYMAVRDNQHLASVSNPNSENDMLFTHKDLSLTGTCQLGLPSFPQSSFRQNPTVEIESIEYCQKQSIFKIRVNKKNSENYRWLIKSIQSGEIIADVTTSLPELEIPSFSSDSIQIDLQINGACQVIDHVQSIIDIKKYADNPPTISFHTTCDSIFYNIRNNDKPKSNYINFFYREDSNNPKQIVLQSDTTISTSILNLEKVIVTDSKGCINQIDLFKQTERPKTLNKNKIYLCEDENPTIGMSDINEYTYEWDDKFPFPQRKINQPGNYTILAKRKDGCDSIKESFSVEKKRNSIAITHKENFDFKNQIERIQLFNTSENNITLQKGDIYFINNTYSIPPSYFPIEIPPTSSTEIQTVYNKKNEKDSLIIQERCSEKRQLITILKEEEAVSGESQCGILLQSANLKGDTLKISYYPNPSNDYLTIDLSTLSSQIDIIYFHIIDFTGKTMKVETLGIGNNKVDMEDMPSGKYIGKVQGYGFQKTFQITITH